MNHGGFIDLVKRYSMQIGFDFSLIKCIQINIYDKFEEWHGKVNPIIMDEELYIELSIHKKVIDNFNTDNQNKQQISQSIIKHELFHCKEISITSTYIDWHKAYFHEPITTTKLLLFDTAIKQWSEYYAYYNSAKLYKRDINLLNRISSSDASLTVMHNKLIEGFRDIQMPFSFITDIISFIHICIIFSAYYNSTNDKKYHKELAYIEHSSLYKKYYPYIKDLSYVMNTLYTSYPKWISESAMIEVGYKLFSFIKINGITYSTNDLSDNFIFIKTDT